MYSKEKVACVISIGTGQANIVNISDPNFIERNIVPIGVIKAVVAISTDCEDTAQQMEKRFKHWPGTYFRFNVEQGLQQVKLGDWEKLGQVADLTRHYMHLEEIDRKLDRAVQALLERRGKIHTLQLSTRNDDFFLDPSLSSSQTLSRLRLQIRPQPTSISCM